MGNSRSKKKKARVVVCNRRQPIATSHVVIPTEIGGQDEPRQLLDTAKKYLKTKTNEQSAATSLTRERPANGPLSTSGRDHDGDCRYQLERDVLQKNRDPLGYICTLKQAPNITTNIEDRESGPHAPASSSSTVMPTPAVEMPSSLRTEGTQSAEATGVLGLSPPSEYTSLKGSNSSQTEHEKPSSSDHLKLEVFGASTTDGYISFSESDGQPDTIEGDTVYDYSSSCGEKMIFHPFNTPKVEEKVEESAARNQDELDSNETDKWDWSDNSSEDEPTETQRSWHTREALGLETKGSKSTHVTLSAGIPICYSREFSVRGRIDRLGRRENFPSRVSSSSSDHFEGWGDDTEKEDDVEEEEEEEEEEDDDDDDDESGAIYDWITMDTAEDNEPYGTYKPGEKQSSKDPEGAGEDRAASSRPRADANPLTSKLGLEMSVRRTGPLTSGSRGMLTRRGRGPARGRGIRVLPGRGGRPLYRPHLQVLARHPHAQEDLPTRSTSQNCPDIGAGIRGSRRDGEVNTLKPGSSPRTLGPTTSPELQGDAGKGGSSGHRAVSSRSQTFTINVVSTPSCASMTCVTASSVSAFNTAPKAPSAPPTVFQDQSKSMCETPGPGRTHVVADTVGAMGVFSGPGLGANGKEISGVGGHPSASPCSSHGTTQGGGEEPSTSTSATMPRGPRPSGTFPAAGRAGDETAAGGGGTGSGGGSGGSDGGSSGGAGPSTGVVRPLASPGPMAMTSVDEEMTVKDTANVTRKKAQLPQQEQLEHPTPVGGSWLKNRYIVNNFILLDPLGAGSYAEVRLAKEKTSNKLYAVKIMNKDFLKKRQVGKEGTFMDDIKREIAIMKKVYHSNVLRLYEVMDDPKVNKLYLVLEYCKKGDLMNILNGDTRAVTCDPMNDTDVWYIMRQVVQGLSFLHVQNIVHGDIKPQNLLVGADNVVKIADFGISKFVQGAEQRLHEQAGTPTFMSPELCSGGEYSGQLADVWALGATMYMIRCGKPPFVANQVMVLYEKIQKDPLEFPPEVDMCPGLRRLLRAMMEKDPANRIPLDQVVSDQWLQQGDHGFSAAAMSSPRPRGTHVISGAVVPGATPGTATNATSSATCHTANIAGDPISRVSHVLGLGNRPPPPLSIQPLKQQGYNAIRVSKDEVDRSINHGTTTQRFGDGGKTAEQKDATKVLGQPRSKEFCGSPPRQQQYQHRLAMSADAEDRGDDPATALPSVAEPRELGSDRRHLSKTEESWKYRSFKKKIGAVDGSRFRAFPIAQGGVGHALSQNEGGTDKASIGKECAGVFGISAAKTAAGSTASGDTWNHDTSSDRDGSDDFSDDPDTLFETEPRTVAGATQIGGEALTRGHGTDWSPDRTDIRAPRTKPYLFRQSTEKFDAVMDTLAAQPTLTGDQGRRSLEGGRTSTTRPLLDIRLRGGPAIVSPAGASNGRLGLLSAVSQRQGKRPSQEDRIKAATDLASAVVGKVDRPYLFQQFALFGVFDGHNGCLCSEALATRLHVAVARHPAFHQFPDKALAQTFESFDRDLCVRQAQEDDTSGSTALVVLFDGRRRCMHVANVGDSRCVVSGAGVARRLSNDHRLTRPEERGRIAASGGFVANNRINGVLAISRSFGDVQHKGGKSSGLIATPEVVSEVIGAGLEFAILATDGLWDVIDDQQAVNFVRLHLSKNLDLSLAAKELTKHALEEGSVDNVSVVIVWLQDSTEGHLQVPSATPRPSSISRSKAIQS